MNSNSRKELIIPQARRLFPPKVHKVSDFLVRPQPTFLCRPASSRTKKSINNLNISLRNSFLRESENSMPDSEILSFNNSSSNHQRNVANMRRLSQPGVATIGNPKIKTVRSDDIDNIRSKLGKPFQTRKEKNFEKYGTSIEEIGHYNSEFLAMAKTNKKEELISFFDHCTQKIKSDAQFGNHFLNILLARKAADSELNTHSIQTLKTVSPQGKTLNSLDLAPFRQTKTIPTENNSEANNWLSLSKLSGASKRISKQKRVLNKRRDDKYRKQSPLEVIVKNFNEAKLKRFLESKLSSTEILNNPDRATNFPQIDKTADEIQLPDSKMSDSTEISIECLQLEICNDSNLLIEGIEPDRLFVNKESGNRFIRLIGDQKQISHSTVVPLSQFIPKILSDDSNQISFQDFFENLREVKSEFLDNITSSVALPGKTSQIELENNSCEMSPNLRCVSSLRKNKSSREEQIIAIPASTRKTPPSLALISTKRRAKKSRLRLAGCRCGQSKCLRLHCICFKRNQMCSPTCRCKGCFNKPEHRMIVNQVVKTTQEINPHAFEAPTIEVEMGGKKITLTKGCNCSKNNCTKNYCQCKKLGLVCSTLCRCEQCENCKMVIDPALASQLSRSKSRKKKKIVFAVDCKNNLQISQTCINKTANPL